MSQQKIRLSVGEGSEHEAVCLESGKFHLKDPAASKRARMRFFETAPRMFKKYSIWADPTLDGSWAKTKKEAEQ